MRHTTKMLMVPEDVYKELVAAAATASSRRPTTLKLVPSQSNNDDDVGNLLTQTKKTMKKIVENKRSNPDERQIHLMQQFNRYKKLKADLEQKPVKVHVDNMETLIDEKRRRENELARRSILKRQIREFPANLASPIMENWEQHASEDDGNREETEGEEDEEVQEPPRNVNKYQRKKLPSPNKVQLRTRIKLSKKVKPYPDISPVPSIAREQIFSTIRQRNKTAYAGVAKFETPRRAAAFKPKLWQQ